MPDPPWNPTAGTSPSPPKQTASTPHQQHPQQGVGVVVEDSNGGNGGSSSTSEIISRAQVTLTTEMVHLLTTYRTSVATWMDIFDYGCAYQLEVLRRCMTSKLLIRSVCAFTAKHLSLLPSGDVWVAPATRYYGESLRGLIGYIGTGSVPEDVLTATILLCSYEIIATQGKEHQRHLSGAKLLILNRGVSASSVGLDRANFWIYIRHEITVALFNKTTLQISPKDWRVNWRETEVEEDVLANQLLWLLGRAIDVVFRQEQSVFTTTTRLCDERQEIYAEVATWFRCWSPSFKGIENHALEIGCIMLSDIPNSVRSFSSQAIFYAAKHITGISRKIRLWNMLDDIETRLGFRTRDQVKKLKELVETNI
ncbi:C6 zinc finger domain protein [Colletotrichum tofieldiae]|nr:C6 zinc finger domain protein [Colletotrichum tofieldiae]GKT70163.1 C6 zinc finger domain protein [Colletotrichum tofieldiae]